ncbi:Spo0E like sporulation regulatory protein [compost metagenome]
MDIGTVNKLIECRRVELSTLASIYGIRDHRVLEKSVQLDRILNVYIRRKQSQDRSKHSFNRQPNRMLSTGTEQG